MYLIRLGLSVIAFASFSAVAGGAWFNNSGQHTSLKKEHYQTERPSRRSGPSRETTSATAHGGTELPGAPTSTASGAAQVPAAGPDETVDIAATSAATAKRGKVSLDRSLKGAAYAGFCGDFNSSSAGPMVSLFYNCFHHSESGSTVPPSMSFANGFNASRSLANGESSLRTANLSRIKYDVWKSFRKRVFGASEEAANQEMSDEEYSGRVGCEVTGNPATATLSYPGFHVSCNMYKNRIGKLDCEKENIYIGSPETPGVKEKLCPLHFE